MRFSVEAPFLELFTKYFGNTDFLLHLQQAVHKRRTSAATESVTDLNSLFFYSLRLLVPKPDGSCYPVSIEIS